ncbi:hypothetical protein [Burkholderia mallei]|uniref:Uncharacterized protein n=1 Tax=Burkholderia mallei (strain ATCC 23344) TaxID=243160 RepID=A0A0H2XDB0_BURMA|nr:hypothetical protein [Burkholderia mallei]AAY59195.1 hypothetical protein BMAA0161 [Burkholderia mallei ATCC 23344]EEP86126.1 conserved hypothetical protein [Burkholderia mallei GB8 horse 4]RPA10667.1 hypothetical protein EGT58_001555 [Burkholderia mallei]RPA21783.1 hypothetical protein EGT61_010175 [Burkholderia mallei]WPJ46568.1 hypothetical protein atcc23344_001322 [Burkholderia mallei]
MQLATSDERPAIGNRQSAIGNRPSATSDARSEPWAPARDDSAPTALTCVNGRAPPPLRLEPDLPNEGRAMTNSLPIIAPACAPGALGTGATSGADAQRTRGAGHARRPGSIERSATRPTGRFSRRRLPRSRDTVAACRTPPRCPGGSGPRQARAAGDTPRPAAGAVRRGGQLSGEDKTHIR